MEVAYLHLSEIVVRGTYGNVFHSATLCIMSDHITFMKNFLRHPTQVGAIAPSSPSLVRTMVDWFDWGSARHVVEFGPGTGVFTEAYMGTAPAVGYFGNGNKELISLPRTIGVTLRRNF